MLKIRDPNTRAIVSGVVALVSFFVWMWLFGVYQDNMSIREEMIAAKPAVFVSIVLSGITFLVVAFATRLDDNTIESLEIKMSVSHEETEIRSSIKRIRDTNNEIATLNARDPMIEKMDMAVEIILESLKALKLEIQPEDMTHAQDLRIMVSDTADGLEKYHQRLKRVKLQPDLMDKIKEDRENVAGILLGFLTFLDKVSPSVDGNPAFKLALMKMGAWGYTNQLEELNEIRRLKKEQ